MKMSYIYTMEFYPAGKKHKIIKFEEKIINLEIILSELPRFWQTNATYSLSQEDLNFSFLYLYLYVYGNIEHETIKGTMKIKK